MKHAIKALEVLIDNLKEEQRYALKERDRLEKRATEIQSQIDEVNTEIQTLKTNTNA